MSEIAQDVAAMFRDSFERYTRDHYRFEDRFALSGSACGYSTSAWQDYAEMGWLALRLPESYGGVGADAFTLSGLMEQVGSRLLMEPILSSVILGSGLLIRRAGPSQLDEWLPEITSGSLKLACAEFNSASSRVQLRGTQLFGAVDAVLHGDVADRIIVLACDEDFGGKLVPVVASPAAVGVLRKSYRLVDGRGAASLTFTGARVERLMAGVNQDELTRLDLEASVGLCAEAVGCMQSLVDSTADYLKIRKQFGRTIASNQAIQHRLVDAYMLLEQSRALLEWAVQALACPTQNSERTIHGARAFICSSSRKIANEALQMHGGIGITDELPISHYFRRLMVNRQLFGSPDQHFESFRRFI